MDVNEVRKNLRRFPYVALPQADRIVEFYKENDFADFEPYPGGIEFVKGFKRASLLRTEGVIFTTTASSATPTLIVEEPVHAKLG